jgi:UDP-2-acetamido-2,6-beta-L-arabino-hexul-4-ose reductase
MNIEKKIKIGITGQAGFIGSHLYNELGLNPEKYERIPFEDHYFADLNLLFSFVKQCDVIIHLAGVNRHQDQNELYRINLELVTTLINSLEHENVNPHIIFSSSIQEQSDNLYGKSKMDGRILFEDWARKHNASFTGLVIPNVFGPFCLPNYNSFIASFCHKLIHNQKTEIIADNGVDLIFVSSLCRYILQDIDEIQNSQNSSIKIKNIQPDFSKKVSEILVTLNTYREQYIEQGIIPVISSMNEINLFNTFRSYVDIHTFFPFTLKQNIDARGTFVETIKSGIGGQISFSTTKPGITRGNHFHTRKIERFIILKGNANIQLRKIGTTQVAEFLLNSNTPSFVDMPVWYTHNITNIGDDDLYMQFWINEWYDNNNPDTYFENVQEIVK